MDNQFIMHQISSINRLPNVTSQQVPIYVDISDTELPDGLLILDRSGIFVIDNSPCDIYIFPRHRDNFGIYWKRQTKKCQSPTHLNQSVAKPCRGIQASICKELWMTKRISLPVGSSINL